jgi:hypothetical protein
LVIFKDKNQAADKVSSILHTNQEIVFIGIKTKPVTDVGKEKNG